MKDLRRNKSFYIERAFHRVVYKAGVTTWLWNFMKGYAPFAKRYDEDFDEVL